MESLISTAYYARTTWSIHAVVIEIHAPIELLGAYFGPIYYGSPRYTVRHGICLSSLSLSCHRRPPLSQLYNGRQQAYPHRRLHRINTPPTTTTITTTSTNAVISGRGHLSSICPPSASAKPPDNSKRSANQTKQMKRRHAIRNSSTTTAAAIPVKSFVVVAVGVLFLPPTPRSRELLLSQISRQCVEAG